MQKAVIYARYSSSAQNEQSIEGQLRECYAYAAKNEYTVVHEYIDRAISGKTDERADFQQMISDSTSHGFDAVIVYKTDRFSRNRYDSAVYKAQLKKNGVRVLYAKEPVPDGIEGILLESLLEGMAEYYSAELSQKLRRGMHESALKCQALGGNGALGYFVGEDKKFHVDEATAPIVRKIFEMYADGNSCKDICDALNALGIKTSRGGAYNKNSLRTILKNEKYIGVYQVKEIRIEGGVPAIVDRELFDKVQKMMANNSSHPQHHRAKINYPLSGKLFCGHCNSPIIGVCGTGKSKERHYYYKCTGRKEGNCKKQIVTKEWLEKTVCDETVKNVLRDDMLDVIAERCASISQKESKENTEVDALKKHVTEIKKSIDGVMNAIEMGVVTRTTKARLQELESQLDNAEYELAQAKKKAPILLKHEIKYMLSCFCRKTTDNLDAYNEDIINTFVHKVFLYDDRMAVVYNLSKGDGEFMTSWLYFDDPNGGKRAPSGSSVACSSPPNVYWTNTYFFSGGFAVKVSL